MSVTSDNLSVTHPSSSGGRVLQAKFIRPAQMSLFARLTCYPPLGEVTCVKRSLQPGSVADDKVGAVPLVGLIIKLMSGF